jgi:serine phosphatase RsbU (regulator of sigma subunit)/anti-sigma regulatory factor (Ser/Thr protein kinase)/predicted ester cyclase
MSAEDNKALIRRFVRAQWAKDLAALEEMMAPDFVDHSVLPGQGSTREDYLQDVAEDQAASSDAILTIEDQMAEGDKVISRLSIRGSHDQEMVTGMPPTGVKLGFTGIIINRVVDGKIAEEWSEGTYAYELTQQRLDQELRERERFEQELRVAQRIQQALLPKELPLLDDWDIVPYYQPAREVGGDFYDFLTLPDGRMGVIIGDVSGKGIAAALVMANTQSVLRAVARRGNIAPGQVLAEANEVLYAYIPSGTFVTCFYGVLDPKSGRLVYANAGHDPPYSQQGGDAQELRARGMPLGLMPGMPYEEKEDVLAAGDDLLLYSDGLVEAHDPEGQMFGFPRLRKLVMAQSGGSGEELVDILLAELVRFTGADSEQEDDITLVTLERSKIGTSDLETPLPPDTTYTYGGRRVLADFTVPSEPGNERPAMEKVADAVKGLPLSEQRLDRLKTAVAEATMNAMEHGNRYDPEVPVRIQVWLLKERLLVRIIDRGSGPLSSLPAKGPDLEAKLEHAQTPRGWGVFLIERMVDEVRVSGNPDHHTLELIMRLEAGKDAS